MEFHRMATRLVVFAVAAITVSGCPASGPAPEAADLVLLNGKIVTVDESVPQVEALAARDGLIVAVGTTAEIERYAGPDTERIDLEGRLGVPGFIEGHGHFLGVGDSRIQLDLRAAGTWDEIVARVAAAAAEAEPGAWIRGRGWHQDKWDAVPEPAVEGFPVHDSLSAASPENPVLLTHASGHALFANARAMELAGVDASTPDPPGGEILRGPDGRPTGLFRENAEELIHAARGGGEGLAEVRKMVELASVECLAKGVTSFQDAGTSFEDVALLRQVADEALGIRLWMMVRDSNEELAAGIGALRDETRGDRRLTVGGIKVSVDGALGSRGAWLLEPYTDKPDWTGLETVPMESVRETAEIAVDHGVQLCIHAIGDRANREVLDVYEETFAAHPDKTDLRWRIEHAQHLHPDDIPRFGELGVIASVQTVHCTSDGPWVPDRIGDRRAEEGAYVWRKLIETGAHVLNGTDVPVEDVSPIANFHAAVSRRLPDGSRFYPDQVLGREEALRTATLDAAWGVFEEDVKGSLSAGKLADVVVLSNDILTIAEDDIPATRVDLTILGGEVVYRRSSP
jgi:hypothetical protein